MSTGSRRQSQFVQLRQLQQPLDEPRSLLQFALGRPDLALVVSGLEGQVERGADRGQGSAQFVTRVVGELPQTHEHRFGRSQASLGEEQAEDEGERRHDDGHDAEEHHLAGQFVHVYAFGPHYLQVDGRCLLRRPAAPGRRGSSSPSLSRSGSGPSSRLHRDRQGARRARWRRSPPLGREHADGGVVQGRGGRPGWRQRPQATPRACVWN